MGALDVSSEQLTALAHGTVSDFRFEPLELEAGPRSLPAWVSGAHIDWVDGYGNSPRFKVRCRTNPLSFSTSGEPVWEKRGAKLWIAERDGVAAAHYHDGAVAMREFKDFKAWKETTPENKWSGEAEYSTYSMLATTRQEGYGGSHFDVCLRTGETVRLVGPWHGSAPEGFTEVSYFVPREGYSWDAKRPWAKRGGYFGLCLRDALFLDIFATYLPHVNWCRTFRQSRVFGERVAIEPLRPETGLPKGVYVSPAECPGHRFGLPSYQTGPHPGDRCLFCEQRRDPAWVNPYGQRAA